MKILAIETSCDETAVAIVTRTGKSAKAVRTLANLVSSQAKLHEKFGGVVPNLARREHEKNLVPLLTHALSKLRLIHKSKTKFSTEKIALIKTTLGREEVLREKFIMKIAPLPKPDIDLIAVTNGPGLAPALWTGINFAKALSILWEVPLIPINHMEGHIYSALFKEKQKNIWELQKIKLPAIALLVSGGHTELHLIKKLGEYKRLGETLDDAAGEAFDKVAKMLGLPYPGGPQISAIAEINRQSETENFRLKLPRPMINSGNYNFSFSGLKTAVLYFLRDTQYPLKKIRSAVAREFEDATVEVLINKTLRAVKEFSAKTVLVGGGVAANKKLRARLKQEIKKLGGIQFLAPETRHTGDNALMIALAALFKDKKNTPKNIGADPSLRL